MNKQTIAAFAEEARQWRLTAKKNEASGNITGAEYAFTAALTIEATTIKVAQQFLRAAAFDVPRFRQSCNPDLPNYWA